MEQSAVIDVKSIENSLNTLKDVKSFDDEHKAFAASRVDQFVYVPTKDSFFSTLDQHADTLEADIKAPLVLVGNEGSGKSALLANWIAKRMEHKHREEFLFQHYVGCSTSSLQLSHTLLRLETALNDFFQLHDMTVPDSEEDLRWSLNRFLAAAAKKHSPARIVIVIDGVHRLKNETGPDGALHWLPTELPSCVRFIVSTVEYDRAKGNDSLQHRSFVELSRRNCPLLRIEPLSVPTRHSIIDAFTARKDGIELSENQQFKIVTAQTTSQPMYLRSLLQSLRLARTLTEYSIDNLLDILLPAETAHELIHESLNIYLHAIFPETLNSNTPGKRHEALGKILAMVYVSRNGLSFEEVWGVLNIAGPANYNITSQLNEEIIRKLFLVLKDFTMVVNNMYSFTHELYREVVYSKFITSKDSLIRWHNLIAKYFANFPSCNRKLSALPYHLEEAGSWARVKNCLTDIEMFRLWWRQKSKSDLIKYWASLTRCHQENASNTTTTLSKKRSGISSAIAGSEAGENDLNNGNAEHGNQLGSNQIAKRPTYDIVDEYVKSLEEYRATKQPSDEVVADIVLEIADFLLEFAIAGHEAAADAPANVHPMIPKEDLEALGVPYVDNDRDGRSSLHYPAICVLLKRKLNAEDGLVGSDAPSKAMNEIPEYTTYYFTRWMWIQYPYVALGNSNARYEQGLSQKSITDANEREPKPSSEPQLRPNSSASSFRRGLTMSSTGPATTGKLGNMEGFSKLDTSNLKLPEIPKFHRKVARSVRKVMNNEDHSNPMDEISHKLMMLQDDIQGYRDECDFLGQLKSTLEHKLFEIKGQLIDLERSEEACHTYDNALADIITREKESFKKAESVQTLNKNLKNILAMCERHPASFPSAIEDLKNKIVSDDYLLKEIKQRLWEQKFERQSHEAYYRQMKKLVREGTEMHKQLLKYRITARKNIAIQALEDEKKIKNNDGILLQSFERGLLSSKLSAANATALNNRRSGGNKAGAGAGQVDKSEGFVLSKNQPKTWDETWAVVSSRTGITDPDIFFHRINNGKVLEDQMNLLKKQSEHRLEILKKEAVNIEAELEETRYAASFVGGQSIKEQQKAFMEKQFVSRHIKERAEATEQLQQRVLAGLVHLGEMLGIQPRGEDSSVTDLQRDIEAVLDTLIDEREKQIQQQGQTAYQNATVNSSQTSDTFSRSGVLNTGNPETHHRAPELDFIISKFEVPTVRLPDRIPSKFNETVLPSTRSEDEDEQGGEEGTWDRAYVKSQSLKNVRMEMKRAARNTKLDSK